ncbi:MAG: hypothetical protein MUE40_03160 [Anaerolineae bacterium]|nr:hypothetical protein [Anaerolineae bacterium]
MMRRVQEHLRGIHLTLGAKDESAGFADVIYHESSPLPALNYVIPRRNTAHVPGSHIEDGLKLLRQRGRVGRVYFAEGLYPPLFIGSLRELGLVVETETPMMVYRPQQGVLSLPVLPPEITINRVEGQQSMGIWWYVWRNAFYDVVTSTVDPIILGQDLRSTAQGNQIDLILYRYAFAVGVVRMTVHDKSACIAARALMKDYYTPELMRLLQGAAVRMALDAGCDLVFMPGETDAERQLCRDSGFIDAGSMVCYVESSAIAVPAAENQPAEVQPVLIL